MSEIVLNGAKLWAGTTVEMTMKEPEDPRNAWSQEMIVRPPEGEVQILSATDELVIDGLVINGPHEGWKFETRRVGNRGRLLRDCYYKGEHGPRCEQTDDGWICRDPCTVEDLPTTPSYQVTLDDLLEVVESIERRWLRVYWSLSRHSFRYRFVNGRTRAPQGECLSRAVWHEGRTWTKRGARRQIQHLTKPSI